MLNRIAAIIRKDLLVRFSAPSELLFFLVLPIFFTALLGGATGGDDGDVQLPLAVVMEDEGALAQRLLADLEAVPSIDPVVVSLEEAEQMVAAQEASALLLAPAGFSEQVVQGEEATLHWRALPDDTNALALRQTVQAVVDRMVQATTAARAAVEAAEETAQGQELFADEAARQAYYEQSLAAATALLDEAPPRLVVRQALLEGEEFSPTAQASAGQMITWVLVPLLGTSWLFAYERQLGTLRRLLSTPGRKGTFLLGAISSQMVAGLLQMVLLVGFGIFVLDLPWGRSPLALLLLLVAFGLAAVALGAALGTVIRTERQANGVSLMLGMALALLGGCWYPIELFPPAVQTAVRVLPTTWAMQGSLDLIVRGGGVMEILPEVGVLLGYAVVFFVVGVGRFRWE